MIARFAILWFRQPVNWLKLAIACLATALFCAREGFLLGAALGRVAALALAAAALYALARPLARSAWARSVRYTQRQVKNRRSV